MFIKFGMGVIFKKLSSKGAFCENRFNDNDKVLKDVNDGVRYQHKMLLNICDLRENRPKEDLIKSVSFNPIRLRK